MTFSVCRHQKILLPWERDVTTSPLYRKSRQKFGLTDFFSEAAEHYQVTFATGVKRRKVGYPFSLTFFCPDFDILNFFATLKNLSKKLTSKKFKDDANLLFRGLIIANTYAPSMRSRVSYRFQIDSSYTCEWAKTLWEDAIFFWKRRKKVAFSNEYGYVWTGP